MIKIIRYTADRAGEWNAFVESSKNGTFLFVRDYMDYHSDRFHDHSLMYYDEKERLVALLPANEAEETFCCHQGLTYGSFVLSENTHAAEVLELFSITKVYLKEKGFRTWYYKAVPEIYHKLPAKEDEYALWRNDATVTACGLATTIPLRIDEQQYRRMVNKNRYYTYGKLKRDGYTMNWNTPLEDFWGILEANLMMQHNCRPVHTLQEMQLLQSRFPDKIVCCTAVNAAGEIEAGAVLYLMSPVVHAQYVAPTIKGRKTNASNFLIISIVMHFRELAEYVYFDYGISTEEHGHYLNEGLCISKEHYGGRATVYKQYELTIE